MSDNTPFSMDEKQAEALASVFAALGAYDAGKACGECIAAIAADRDRLAAELARVTAERDALRSQLLEAQRTNVKVQAEWSKILDERDALRAEQEGQS